MRQKVFFALSSVNSARGQQMDSCLLVTAGVLTLSSSSFVETQSLLQRTIVPECLMHQCSFRAFCCNPFSSFVLWLLFLYSVCVSVWAWLCVLVWYISFFKIILHTMDLFDNCAVGDINYTFSIFTVSSHHLQRSVCVWGWRKWARALLYLPVFKRSLFPSALPEPSCIKEQEIHYAYLRCFGKFLLLLSKLDNSSAGAWCCSTLRDNELQTTVTTTTD